MDSSTCSEIIYTISYIAKKFAIFPRFFQLGASDRGNFVYSTINNNVVRYPVKNKNTGIAKFIYRSVKEKDSIIPFIIQRKYLVLFDVDILYEMSKDAKISLNVYDINGGGTVIIFKAKSLEDIYLTGVKPNVMDVDSIF
uniref:Uncharacterized protein n=1 Tax=Pithovirus LCPAC403 TaxID=2506596 RepID=A0A481ZC92_9VIRU|nr:MAG: hypothetical protein LCPAC403_00960 [Pithovirus LCPAC403]